MKIILTGATGLIGSRFEELMFENHEIIPLSSAEVNIVNNSSVSTFFEDKNADAVIHFAAKTDVDKCEEDKGSDLELLGIGESQAKDFNIEGYEKDFEENGSAFSVNFIGTRNLYNAAKKKGIKFIYISTDFVFDGNGEYDETSDPSPINWYGMTKYYGEKLIDLEKNLIIRLSFPYGYKSPVKDDFVWKLINLLKDREEVGLIEDQTITPTFIDDIVRGLDLLLSKNMSGIYHITGSSFENPFQIGHMIKDVFKLKTKIKTTTREKLYKDRAQRPFKSLMKNAKIKQLGFEPKSFEQGLGLIKSS